MSVQEVVRPLSHEDCGGRGGVYVLQDLFQYCSDNIRSFLKQKPWADRSLLVALNELPDIYNSGLTTGDVDKVS